MPTSGGFTLVELLIAILIIAVISTVTIPNIKKFGTDQQLNDAANNIINVLKQAQSGDMSDIRCNSTASTQWNFNFLTNTTYSLSCQSGAPETTISSGSFSSNPSIRQFTPTNCTAGVLLSKIYFMGNSVKFTCADGITPPGDIYFTLKNTSTNKCIRITVGLGGTINKENTTCT